MINGAVPGMMAEQQPSRVESNESSPSMLKRLFKLLARKILGIDFDQNSISSNINPGEYFYPGMTQADQDKIMKALHDVSNGRNMDEAQGILHNAKNMRYQINGPQPGSTPTKNMPFGIDTSVIGSSTRKKSESQYTYPDFLTNQTSAAPPAQDSLPQAA